MERDEGRGRVALVTGGASGIGLATAEVLAGRGWRVVVGDRDVERGEAEAGRIGVEFVALDVVDEAAMGAALDDLEGRFGPVEGLFANAGLIQPGGRPEERPMVEFDQIVAVNLRGVYVSCLGAGQRMARRGRGGIVVTGSVTSLRNAPLHAYAPTKAAVVHLAAGLAAEWGRSGVRVNAVSPGFVATPPIRRAMEQGLRDRRQLEEAAAMGRLVEAVEVGRAVAFLLSDDASAVTGVNLPVDCGWLAGAHLGTWDGVREAR